MKKKQVQALLAGMSAMMAVMLPTTSVLAAVPEKEQTVYVNADENGNSQDVIVSNWLKNQGNEQELTDKTNLTDIQNVKGDETFEQKNDGTIVWNADGEDIYYQGKTQEELPVSVKLTYYLDGKEISAKDLAGKSGKLKIRIDYENKSKEVKEIQGKQEEICTPFMMMTAMILPAETFSNVEITNGQIISDGNNDIAVGVGFPGLAESLKLQDVEELKDVDFPDYAELTADVKDFSLAMTATVATTGLLDDLDLANVNSTEDLKEQMETLADSSQALVKGSSELQSGIATLDSSADTFVSGLTQVDDGTAALKSGIDTMNSKKSELLDGVTKLTDGMKSLQSGSAGLQDGVAAYTDGASQLGAGIAQTAEGAAALNQGIQELNDKKTVLTDGAAKLAKGASDLNAGAGNLASGVQAYTAGVEQLHAGISALDDKVAGGAGQLAGAEQAMGTIVSGAKDLISGAGALKQGMEGAAGSVKIVNDQVKSYANAAANESRLTDQAMAVIQNYIDVQAQPKVSAEDINNQANAAIAAENASVNAQANAQMQEKVSAALAVAGVSAEQQSAVMSALGGISVGVQTSANISVPQTTSDADTIAQLNGIKRGMEAGKAAFSIDTLTEIKNKLGEMEGQCTTAAQGADLLAAGVKEFAAAAEPMKNLSGMMQELAKATGQLKQGSTALCSKNEELNNGAASLSAGAGELNNGMTTLSGGTQQVSAGISKLAEGSNQLAVGTAQLKTGSEALMSNSTALNQGASQLNAGAGQLLQGGEALSSGAQALGSGITQLATGAVSLKDGTAALASGGKQLKEGTTKLNEGSTELAEGMEKFDEEGIQKITKLLGDDLQVILDRLHAVTDADGAYKAFDGQNENGSGKVKFIIETAGIEE